MYLVRFYHVINNINNLKWRDNNLHKFVPNLCRSFEGVHNKVKAEGVAEGDHNKVKAEVVAEDNKLVYRPLGKALRQCCCC
jgi:hypothetical protein